MVDSERIQVDEAQLWLATKVRQAADEAWELGQKDICGKLHAIGRELEGFAADPPVKDFYDITRDAITATLNKIQEDYERQQRR